MPFRLRNDIHTEIHPIDHVDVSISWWAEHDLGPWCESFCRMRCQIMRSKISFVFYNPANPLYASRYMNEVFPQQLPGNDHGVPIIKCSSQFLHKLFVKDDSMTTFIKKDNKLLLRN